MTVKQVKEAKVDLELKVLDLLKSFEKETELKISYINTARKQPKGKATKSNMPEPFEPYKGPLTDVTIVVSMDVALE